MTVEPSTFGPRSKLPESSAPVLSVAHARAAAGGSRRGLAGLGITGGGRANVVFGRLLRIGLALAALWLFLSAITVMKSGAGALAPALQGSGLTDSAASTLGFGWLGAMLVMSGSPVAVSALTFLHGDVVNTLGAFTMLTGSRLGAAFVVLTVAFVYALRGGQTSAQRQASLSIGVISLLLTALVYVPAMAIGIPLLTSGSLDAIPAVPPPGLLDVVSMLTAPVTVVVYSIVPDAALFFAGLGLLLISLRLLDRSLPEAGDAAQLEEHTGWRSRRWVMFGVGSLVALVTMSVSVALTVLVPAVSKGYFRRRQVLPYIMGANIMTLGDTLLTAYVVGEPAGVHVVIAEMAGTFLITMVLLALLYKPLVERVLQLTDAILASRRRLGTFVAVLFFTPVLLVWAF